MAGYTLQQLQQMGGKPGTGKTLQELQSQPDFPQSDPTHKSFLQRVKTTIQNSANQVNDALGGNGNFSGKSVLNRATGAVAGAFNAIPGVAMDALPEKASNAINKGTNNLLNWFANNAGKNPFGGSNQQGLVDNPIYQNFANSNAGKTTEDIAGIASNAGQIAGDILTADQAAKGIQKTADLTNKVVAKVAPYDARSGNFGSQPPQPLDEAKILDRYNRAIKPTVAGKTNATQIAKGNTQVIKAVKAIGDNKANLSFTDANGEPVTGQLPKTVDQFTQAITQTKKGIFQQYDALAKQAGEQGIKVDTTPIADELNPVINSKTLGIANPRAIEYATNLQQRLLNEGSLTAPEVQDLVQHYNEALKAFYRNPNYETASNAGIDAMIANKFRAALDTEITNSTGTQYQALKDAYGALANIEKDVTHRNIVWGRQNTVGLANNLSSVASGAELVRGLIRLNPADLATAGVIKGIQKYIQYLNNPDVGISKIFSAVEKSNPSSIEGSLPQAGLQPGGSSFPEPSTPKLKSQVKTGVPQTLKGNDLITEARKYKSAEEFVKASQQADLMDLSNRPSHRIGRIFSESGDGGVQDLPAIVKQYGEDLKYTPDAKVPMIKSPNDKVTVYRSVPKGIKNIEAGDYVSFSKDYAAGHERGAIVSMKVPAKDVIWQGNDFNEWVYSPADIRAKYKDLTDIWKKAHKK